VFELVRGRSATALASLTEALSICAKLPSGYQRDLQLLKFPLFRGIDTAQQTLDIVAPALDALKFRPSASASIRPFMPPKRPMHSWSSRAYHSRGLRRVAARYTRKD